MPRDYKVYLEDILEAISKIRSYNAGVSFNDFTNDSKTVDAVILNLEVVGEGCKKVPDSIRDKYPQLEWKKIGGLRDILAHEYFSVNLEIICDIVQNKLPVLEHKIGEIIRERE